MPPHNIQKTQKHTPAKTIIHKSSRDLSKKFSKRLSKMLLDQMLHEIVT